MKKDSNLTGVAVGRSYADVPPNRGVFRGEAEERIAVKVTIDKLDDRLSAHPPISPGSLEIPSFRDGPARAEQSMNMLRLEQQQQQQQPGKTCRLGGVPSQSTNRLSLAALPLVAQVAPRWRYLRRAWRR